MAPPILTAVEDALERALDEEILQELNRLVEDALEFKLGEETSREFNQGGNIQQKEHGRPEVDTQAECRQIFRSLKAKGLETVKIWELAPEVVH